MNISALENLIAIYLGRDNVTDLTLNGEDVGLDALNSARRKAEQAHDFKYAETNLVLPIGNSGAPITNAFGTFSVQVSGSLTPAIQGTFANAGMRNGLPQYLRILSNVSYFVSYTGTQWAITAGGYALTGNYWTLTPSSATNPNGVYAAQGTASGTATVASTAIGIKRIKYNSIPLNNGDLQPIEFLTNDQYISRLRMEIGRPVFDATRTLQTLGASMLGNPLAYQNGQTLYLAPSSLPFPINAQLSIVQWMPDYSGSNTSDFFTQYAPEYMYWQGIVECNNFYKRYTSGRIEGQVSTEDVQALADKCLAAFIAWDNSTERGTTTPMGMPSIPSFMPPQPQAA